MEGRFHVSGFNIEKTLKYRNVCQNERLAFVIDDLVSVEPWAPRGLKVHGIGRIISGLGGTPLIEITPTRKWSWGINEPTFDKDGKPVSDKA